MGDLHPKRRWTLITRQLAVALAALMLVCAGAKAEQFHILSDQRAVSADNGSLGLLGGLIEDDAAGVVFGHFATPVGDLLGFQVDLAAGNVTATTEDLYGHLGLHFFHRRPERYMIGLYASATNFDAVDFFRVGVEAALYFDRLTLDVVAGSGGGQPGATFFSAETLSYYLTDNFRISAGHRHSKPGDMGFASIEYFTNRQFTWGRLALFAEGYMGEDYEALWGGIKFYYGAHTSLRDRDRKNKVRDHGFDALFPVTQCFRTFSVPGGVAGKRIPEFNGNACDVAIGSG